MILSVSMVLCGPITLFFKSSTSEDYKEISVSSTSTLLEDHCLLFEGLGDLLIARTLLNSCDQKELGNRKMLFFFFFTCDPL